MGLTDIIGDLKEKRRSMTAFKETRKVCGKCLKDGTCDSDTVKKQPILVKFGKDKAYNFTVNKGTCQDDITMCSQCIDASIDDDYPCGESVENRDEWMPECRKYLKKAGAKIPLTPEEAVILYGGGGVTMMSVSCCCCMLLLLMMGMK